MEDSDVQAPLLKGTRWRSHWVNGTGFTISMATSAVRKTILTRGRSRVAFAACKICKPRLNQQVLAAGFIVLGASMLVTGAVRPSFIVLDP
jgi:hypothetical protein